jgi:hypothetical protein
LPIGGEYTIALNRGLLKGSYLKGLRAATAALAEPGEAATMAGVRNPQLERSCALRLSRCLYFASPVSPVPNNSPRSKNACRKANFMPPASTSSRPTNSRHSYVTPSGKPVFYPQESARESFNAHIVGQFTGWYGQTVFTLDNGQKWQQAESGSYQCGKFDNPKVTIKPTLMGSWLMYVDPCSNQSLRVTRIK